MRTHKYNATRCEREGISFPSKLERATYDKLVLLQKAQEISFFLRQPRFDLPGGAKYTADFQVFHLDGSIEFWDCKGLMTEAASLRIRMTEALYPVKIKIVRKV